MTMPQHIGIVACSAEGAALCYKTICVEGGELMGPHAHPEVSLHTHSLADYVACLERGDRAGVAALMLSSAHKLARAGADFLICPDNTIHQAMDEVLPRSPLPWLQASVDLRIERKRFSCYFLLRTWVWFSSYGFLAWVFGSGGVRAPPGLSF